MEKQKIKGDNLKQYKIGIGFLLEVFCFIATGFFISERTVFATLTFFIGLGLALYVGDLISDKERFKKVSEEIRLLNQKMSEEIKVLNQVSKQEDTEFVIAGEEKCGVI